MGIIKIKNLKVKTIIGILDYERKNKQEIIINISIDYNSRKASETDDIADALDYKILHDKLVTEIEKSDFRLIEKLSDYIISMIMEDSKVTRIEIEIDKPAALEFAESVSFTAVSERSKNMIIQL